MHALRIIWKRTRRLTHGDLILCCSEFVAALRSFGLELDQSELNALMAEFDEDNNNEIELEEFVMQMKRISRARHQQHEQEQQVQQYASNTTYLRANARLAGYSLLCASYSVPT